MPERGRGCSVGTIHLRRAFVRYLHHLAGVALPTGHARVTETVAAIRRSASAAGKRRVRKTAATLAVLTRIMAPVPDDLVGLRDRALLLLAFAGAWRWSGLAPVRVGHIEPRARGLQLTLARPWAGGAPARPISVPWLPPPKR